MKSLQERLDYYEQQIKENRYPLCYTTSLYEPLTFEEKLFIFAANYNDFEALKFLIKNPKCVTQESIGRCAKNVDTKINPDPCCTLMGFSDFSDANSNENDNKVNIKMKNFISLIWNIKYENNKRYKQVKNLVIDPLEYEEIKKLGNF